MFSFFSFNRVFRNFIKDFWLWQLKHSSLWWDVLSNYIQSSFKVDETFVNERLLVKKSQFLLCLSLAFISCKGQKLNVYKFCSPEHLMTLIYFYIFIYLFFPASSSNWLFLNCYATTIHVYQLLCNSSASYWNKMFQSYFGKCGNYFITEI